MTKTHRQTLLVIAGLAVVAVILRLMPHPANVAPIGALALASGVYLRSRWGILVPAAVMVLTDTIVGWHSLVLFTWGAFLLMGVIGWWVGRRKNVGRIVAGTLAGSVFFYLITNAAVWAFSGMYPPTAAGLVQSYYLALPFFRNTVFGDLFYVGAFFGLVEAVRQWMAATERQEKPVLAPARRR